jgi:arylformamidase
MQKWIIAGVTVALMATASVAQERQRLGAECRKEVRTLCVPGGGKPERGAIKACLNDKASQLSEGCRSEIKARIEQRRKDAPAQPKSEGSADAPSL